MSTDTLAMIHEITASMRASSASLDAIISTQQAAEDLAAYTARLREMPPARSFAPVDLGTVQDWMPEETDQ